MKPVFFNINHTSMKKILSLKELLQGKIVRLGIKEIFPAAGMGKQFSQLNVHLVNRMKYSSKKNIVPTIAIVTPLVLSQLLAMKEKLCRQMSDILFKKNFCFIILSNSLSIPDFLKNSAANYDLPIAASKYDEHHLKSLLREVIREKIMETILVHGVILESKGKGILITGDSGIGKTTAVLKSMASEYYWVADDVAVIKRNKKGELIAGGHKKINRYIHTETDGIIAVVNVIESDRIKTKTKLCAVINIEKYGIGDIIITECKKSILGMKLACLSIIIPSTSFFDENLLKKSVGQLFKDDL